MRYYSLEDICHSHSLSKEAIKHRIKTGKLKAEKLQINQDKPTHFKYIIPESELEKLAEFRTSSPVASKNAQPDYYAKRWEEQEEWLRKWQEYRNRHEARPKRNYYDYMHSEEWRKKRLKVLKRDGFRCQMCGTAKNLRVHHINYEHLDTDAELDDLITLCDTCHTQIHAQDIKKKQPVDLFSLPPASEGESKIELFQLALILLRNKSLSASQKWDRYNQACNSCTPPLSVKKYADIWLQAMKVVEDWRF